MLKRTLILLTFLVYAASANADNISFAGTFGMDDDVQLFNFTTDGASTVYLVSYAYGGGTQADGTVWTAGGMDTILSLFNSAGSLVNSNDDGSSSCFSGAAMAAPGTVNGNADPNTDRTYDTCFSQMLAAGSYTVAVTQYDNFANGPLLSSGFQQDGEGNFTAGNSDCTQGMFCDVTSTEIYTNRTNQWAYDILGVVSADVDGGPAVGVPEPGTLGLLGLGLLGLAARRRRKV